MIHEVQLRLIWSEHSASWEYVAEVCGRMVAASDGDAVFSTPGAALVACVTEAKASLPSSKRDSNGQ